ncbi:fumarate reductase subunit A [Blautia hominis]|uniref:Fumarate reductase subunit A n=1 Tax=Blautia hominis TaxID=2025493 RepID=A0ABQ0BDS0_9FIRM
MANSRRDFMQGTAEKKDRAVSQKAPVRVHACDVLVVGGGIAGMEAALRVVELGKTAIIVDKGVFGHSGTSGMNWGHTYQSMEFSPDDDATIANTIAVMDMVCEGLLNQPYFYHLLKAHKDEKIIQNGLKYGSIPLYNEDGTVLSHNEANPQFPVTHDQGFWPRMMAQWCCRNSNVTEIIDNTYVVDILLSEDGRAAGAVAIDMVDSIPHVFHAKAVIMATGSYCWITGWNGMGAESMAGKENTGDGIGILLRHGIPMADMEQFCGDASQWTPAGVRQTMGNFNFDASQTPKNMIFDKDMVSWEVMLGDEHPMINMGASMRIFYGLRLHGRTTENGGCYIDKASAPVSPRYFRRVEERQKEVLGYDLPQYVEVVPETWDSAGCPRELSDTSETIIPGLFFAGAAPGAVGGMTQIAAQSGGWIAANGAVEIAAKIAAPAVRQEQIDQIIEKAFSYLEKTPKNPIRATKVMRKIQQTYWDRKNGPLKDENKIKQIICELNQILEEDLPRMWTVDKSYRMNCEWRDCFEAENMLYCALGASYAGLLRKESRGFQMRTDYPDPDNSIGLKNTVVQLDENGRWHTDFMAKFDQIIPSSIIAQMVPNDIGLYTFAENKKGEGNGNER